MLAFNWFLDKNSYRTSKQSQKHWRFAIQVVVLEFPLATLLKTDRLDLIRAFLAGISLQNRILPQKFGEPTYMFAMQ